MSEEIKFEFDKFMDDILIKERQSEKRQKNAELTPVQQYANRRRENPYQLIRYSKIGK